MTVSTVRRIDAASFAAPAGVDRARTMALIAGVIGALALGVGYMASPTYFYRAYLVGWLYWTGLSGGSLALAMLHQMTAGRWGMVLRRPFEAASLNLPLMLVLSVPIVLGLDHIYPWMNANFVAHHPATAWKVTNYHYLVPKWWTIRMVVYLAILSLLALRQAALEKQHDQTGDARLMPKMRALAGPGIVVYALVTTFAAVDWLMSIEPDWSSTMYGFYVIISQALLAMVFAIVVVSFLSRTAPMKDVYTKLHFHDYGKLMLAMVMMWTYFCFSQFLIIWAGNLPDEIFWFRERIFGFFGWIGMAVVLFHFAFPFVILLSQNLKKNIRKLSVVAFLLMGMRLVDIFWQSEPGYGDHVPANYWMYLAATLAIGGFWLWFFLGNLKRRPLVPINDPRLVESIGALHE